MGQLIRSHAWHDSALGSPETWPQTLRTALRLMLNTSHPMYIWWGDDLLCFYNDAYRASIGPDRHPSSLGCHGQEVWEEIWPIIGPQIEHVREGRGSVAFENALVPITRNGVLQDVYWTYSYNPIDDDNAPNGVGGVLVICSETTAQRHAEAALREANQRKDEFLATLAHELRNPLAPVRNAAKLLRAPNADAKTREWATTVIDRQIQSMASLLDDLLDVSRITRAQITINKQRIPLSSIVEASLEVAKPLIDARHHSVQIDLPKSPIEVDVDPLRMSQVLTNLLTNAAKYSEPGGRIRLSALIDGEYVRIKVRDSGIGLEPESLTRIFVMFSQVSNALDRSEGGLGIGLALVKGLVELHDGEVSAASDGLGKGSEFTVRLPLPKVGNAPERKIDGEQSVSSTRAHRILIVDDNKDVAHALGLLLELSGHEVRLAFDGEEGLQSAREFRPEIGLLDIGLPRLNGYELAQSIRAEEWGKSITLIAVTGWGHPEEKERAHQSGFDCHVTKPVDPDEIEKLVAGKRPK